MIDRTNARRMAARALEVARAVALNGVVAFALQLVVGRAWLSARDAGARETA